MEDVVGEQLADHLTLQKRSVTEDASPPGEGSQPGREPEEKLRDLESALKALHVARREAKKRVGLYGEPSRFQTARENNSDTEEYSLVTVCRLFYSTLRQKIKAERVSSGWQNKRNLVFWWNPFFSSLPPQLCIEKEAGEETQSDLSKVAAGEEKKKKSRRLSHLL